VCAVAAAAGLLAPEEGFEPRPSPAVLSATDDAAWLCTAVIEHIRELSDRWATQAATLGPFF
jgi:hypothetical protein